MNFHVTLIRRDRQALSQACERAWRPMSGILAIRKVGMRIEVLLQGDEGFQYVPDYLLGRLISKGKIQAFRRSGGWVVIGLDPVRRHGNSPYTGPERRSRP